MLTVNYQMAVDFNFLVFDHLVLLDLLLLFVDIHQRKQFYVLFFLFL